MTDERRLSIEDLIRLAEKTQKQRDDLAAVRKVVAPLSAGSAEALWLITAIDGRALRLKGMQERYIRMADEMIEAKRTESVGVLFISGARMVT